MLNPAEARSVLKMVLLAVTAAAALIGAVLLAVPSAEESGYLCLEACSGL